ncbi:hemerythrin domain-containing protein [Caldimonas brevitalea]|uniref:Regulator of cell morphogenesis and NO signaling n=1 Tax=Caldimonas brevitalea TaxID=413882 RepID=A0A0G3BBI7_9BURK|nr:hemerythrin domain-containing protein [Caldimonas brevitalea]AKJ26739.1 regulator of cell morphogenesis and NO signaling [Caldimonas brevitalea]
MDAIDLLTRQHRELESRMKAWTEADDTEAQRRLFAEVADHLTVHVASEEQVFYPAVKAQRTEDILLESLEEHLSLKRLLADLMALQPDDQTFEPKFKVLKEQTEHHHKEEEENLFPKVKQLLDAPRRATLGEEMLALQMRLRREGRPREAVPEQTDKAAPLA